jgi:hypothetical protein
MKKEDTQWIVEKIFEFMSIINECIISTTYSNDREIYMKDLATVAIWLVRIHKKENIVNLAMEIVSVKTTKYFGDYWKRSPWGEKEIEALENLQDQIKNRFNLANMKGNPPIT